MQAFTIGDHTTLIFTKVMDELSRGPVDEPPPTPTDRGYWETKRATKSTVQLADELLAIAREIDPSLEPQYNKHYIGIYRNGQPFNFCTFIPQKNAIVLRITLPRTDEIDRKIEEHGIETLNYTRWGAYRLSLQREDVTKHRSFLKELMESAYHIRST
jgi:hypothetical protein